MRGWVRHWSCPSHGEGIRGAKRCPLRVAPSGGGAASTFTTSRLGMRSPRLNSTAEGGLRPESIVGRHRRRQGLPHAMVSSPCPTPAIDE